MLVYTFRTYPYLKELEAMFPDVFVFGDLKRDLILFRHLLHKTDSNILGIADAHGRSRIEPIAVNIFNNGKVETDGPSRVELYIDPRLTLFEISQNPTKTFCNWTMYRIQRLINDEQLTNNLSFVHLNVSDLPKLEVLAAYR